MNKIYAQIRYLILPQALIKRPYFSELHLEKGLGCVLDKVMFDTIFVNHL